ncbi:uncharacterized protein BJ212DRAFT_1480757 [Suillus subaureus]|uniref:Myb/SANT-like domain-containing protein n=1 Tax=Suillus subaureus TaxID=48587 RepID=A0A9P7JD68_9AGAM|nr:uncharacterized protein BJ212DRAFT_1480757 [Suillus subaureus]KAG1816308.1 hypothetical protein BJ212DRAFT_1480757 [Suillus subaureus]
MAQPEAHEIPTRRTPAHWRNKEITTLVNHIKDHQDGEEQLKSIHHTIDKYHNQTSTHWDSANGAGIHGPTASTVWDSYIALSSNTQMCPFCNTGWPYFEKMQEIIPLGGTRGRHAFHPGAMGPPPVPDTDEDEPGLAQAPALSSASPSSTSGPPIATNHSSITGPSFTTGPCSITGGLSTATSSAGAKCPYEDTNFNSVKTMSFALTHESV